MANKSGLTRKEQVLKYLSDRANIWVDGPEISNEAVGGSEGLKRLRELRDEDHYRILARKHPNPRRDIWQYKLVLGETIHPSLLARLGAVTPAEVIKESPAWPLPSPTANEAEQAIPKRTKAFPLAFDRATGEYSVVGDVCVQCEGVYFDEAAHRLSREHIDWEKKNAPLIQQQEIGVDPQPPIYKFDVMPERVNMGDVAVCPRCLGHKRPARAPTQKYDRIKGKVVEVKGREAEDFTRDPYKPSNKDHSPNRCPRCNGFGIVPNKGGVA